MLTTETFGLSSSVRVAVSIDLIGDLDATLAATFSETLARLVSDEGVVDAFVSTKHLATSLPDGMSGVGAAIDAARAAGCRVVVDPGSRRMKAAFAAARMDLAAGATAFPSRRGRHLMLARHATRETLRRTA
jgi:hypothetical protein